MKETLKTSPFWPLIRDTYIGLRDLPQLPAAYLHPWRRASIEHLTQLKDIHKGQRAFIIGNGPSLKQTDLSKLQGEITFGMNRIYLMFEELGFNTTYSSVVNDLVIEQTAQDLAALEIPRFVTWRSRKYFEPKHMTPSQPPPNSQKREFGGGVETPPSSLPFSHGEKGKSRPNMGEGRSPTFLYTTYDSPRFSSDVRGRVWEGATVTYVTMQLAFHMGIKEVILVGVDHNYTTTGTPNTTITSTGDDPNHFSGQYFGKGFRWQLPDLETSEMAYRMARKAYENAGRRIVDATVGGKLTIFEKMDYKRLFN